MPEVRGGRQCGASLGAQWSGAAPSAHDALVARLADMATKAAVSRPHLPEPICQILADDVSLGEGLWGGETLDGPSFDGPTEETRLGPNFRDLIDAGVSLSMV